MKGEAFRLIKRFYAFVFGAVMVTVFFCGIIAVWEKGEYALNYEQYATVEARRTQDSLEVCIDGREYCLHAMSDEQEELIKRVLMYTPLSPVVLMLGEGGAN